MQILGGVRLDFDKYFQLLERIFFLLYMVCLSGVQCGGGVNTSFLILIYVAAVCPDIVVVIGWIYPEREIGRDWLIRGRLRCSQHQPSYSAT